MLVPDTKDWTWVLERRCPDCGFDAGGCAASAIPGLIRANGARWRRLLDDGAIRPGRPDEATWSSLEYACHVRDVYRRYRARVEVMLAEDDPRFANWDQDETAVADGYESQDPGRVVGQLESAAGDIALLLEGLVDAGWARPGRRSDGASFTVTTLARYMVHDPIHHVWDVARDRTSSAGC